MQVSTPAQLAHFLLGAQDGPGWTPPRHVVTAMTTQLAQLSVQQASEGRNNRALDQRTLEAARQGLAGLQLLDH